MSYTPLDDFGVAGAITALLRIVAVLRGQVPAAIVTVRYIAHTDLPDDRMARFHLRRTATGIWLVCRKGRGQGYICD